MEQRVRIMLNVVMNESLLPFRKCKLLKQYGEIHQNGFYRFKRARKCTDVVIIIFIFGKKQKQC